MLLLNMVTADELYDDQDYKEILEDISDECGKYGEVEGVRVPRPVPKSKKWEPSDSAASTAEKNRKADEEAGVGRVYVMYKNVEMAQKAMKAIGGRQFAGRTILVATVPEVSALSNRADSSRMSFSVLPHLHRHLKTLMQLPPTQSKISWRVSSSLMSMHNGSWLKIILQLDSLLVCTHVVFRRDVHLVRWDTLVFSLFL